MQKSKLTVNQFYFSFTFFPVSKETGIKTDLRRRKKQNESKVTKQEKG